jgi:hypothetical protein
LALTESGLRPFVLAEDETYHGFLVTSATPDWIFCGIPRNLPGDKPASDGIVHRIRYVVFDWVASSATFPGCPHRGQRFLTSETFNQPILDRSSKSVMFSDGNAIPI